jgi:hydrogenase nickel incorporation protein HypA/HybF
VRAAVCLGSRYRGDDAAGPLVGDRLRAAGAELLECDDEPTRLLDAWAEHELVVVVDAVVSGAAPGTLHEVDVTRDPLPSGLGLASTHALSVTDALELGRRVRDGRPAHPGRRVRAGHGRRTGPHGARTRGEMHEKALMDDLVAKIVAVAETEGGERVTAVRVWLGALSHFTPEHFEEHFVDATAGTVAEGARVEATLDDDLEDPRAQGVVLESVTVGPA